MIQYECEDCGCHSVTYYDESEMHALKHRWLPIGEASDKPYIRALCGRCCLARDAFAKRAQGKAW